MLVEDVMTRRVVAVEAGVPLKHLAHVLLANDVSGVPVVEEGHVVGIVSESDIVHAEAAPDTQARHAPRDVVSGPLVADAMTAPAVTVEPWMSVAAAAAIMEDHGVNRLPVVRRGSLVGIVARADLVRAFARSDEAIRSEIEHQVLPGLEPQLTASDVGVAVDGGDVTLIVEHEVDAEALKRDVRRVAGVVGVHVDAPEADE